jgi:hypothetical protein
MTYEERVERVACHLYNIDSTESLGVEAWFIVYNAIGAEAEAIKEFAADIEGCNNYAENYLKQNGYIPEKEEQNEL